MVVYNPIAGGILSGKYSAASLKKAPEQGRFSDEAPTMGSRYRERYFNEPVFAALSIIEPVVKKHDLTMPETAFRWCAHHSALDVQGGDDGIIIGVSSQAQLEQNLTDLEKGPLPDEVLKALDEAWSVSKATTPNYWHLDLKYTYDTKKALFA